MKSGRQRRQEMARARKRRAIKRARKAKIEAAEQRARYIAPHLLAGAVAVTPALLHDRVSRSDPDFLSRGTYIDVAFTCIDCGKPDVWTAGQQKWWYEVAHGDLSSTAIRCRPCRRRESARKAEARRVHREGLERKRRLRQKD